MTPLTRRQFALLLAMTPGVGGRTVTRVLARNDLLGRTAEDFLKLSPEALREEYKLQAKAATGIASAAFSLAEHLETTQKRLDKKGVTIIAAADAHYPELVEKMDPDPPGVLFLYGNTKLLNAKTFCVLSSRNTSPAGLNAIETLAEEGVLSAEVVVSGHDTPEYQRSALVPLRWGAPRILCLDRGLYEALGPELNDEPFRAARLWRFQFDATTDLVISPFRPDAKFVGVNNKVRDRLIGSLSRRLDFSEIAPGGNMERIAKLALKAKRKVRVCDRTIGYRQLREAGAEILENF